jgi:NAD(P)-dependent dehydrogenase (short-subunit alcohol dehydrogenase family)
MDDVRDRVAFVTGGASGIGLGIAKVLLGAGAKVVIADLRV